MIIYKLSRLASKVIKDSEDDLQLLPSPFDEDKSVIHREQVIEVEFFMSDSKRCEGAIIDSLSNEV